jgi:hypothetical protein
MRNGEWQWLRVCLIFPHYSKKQGNEAVGAVKLQFYRQVYDAGVGLLRQLAWETK